jgi:hypothetical protein
MITQTQVLASFPLPKTLTEEQTARILAAVAPDGRYKSMSQSKQMDFADAIGISVGLMFHITSEVKGWYKAQTGVGHSPGAARMDRLLRTRDSSGKATARR